MQLSLYTARLKHAISRDGREGEKEAQPHVNEESILQARKDIWPQ